MLFFPFFFIIINQKANIEKKIKIKARESNQKKRKKKKKKKKKNVCRQRVGGGDYNDKTALKRPSDAPQI